MYVACTSTWSNTLIYLHLFLKHFKKIQKTTNLQGLCNPKAARCKPVFNGLSNNSLSAVSLISCFLWLENSYYSWKVEGKLYSASLLMLFQYTAERFIASTAAGHHNSINNNYCLWENYFVNAVGKTIHKTMLSNCSPVYHVGACNFFLFFVSSFFFFHFVLPPSLIIFQTATSATVCVFWEMLEHTKNCLCEPWTDKGHSVF